MWSGSVLAMVHFGRDHSLLSRTEENASDQHFFHVLGKFLHSERTANDVTMSQSPGEPSLKGLLLVLKQILT